MSGGVPLMLRVARESGLIDAIDRGLGGPALGAFEVEAWHGCGVLGEAVGSDVDTPSALRLRRLRSCGTSNVAGGSSRATPPGSTVFGRLAVGTATDHGGRRRANPQTSFRDAKDRRINDCRKICSPDALVRTRASGLQLSNPDSN